MAGQLNPSPLGAVGAYGMNTQASPIDLPPQFATLAINCFADEAGRPTARKSMVLESSANTELASAPIKRCYRHNSSAGVGTMVLAGAGCIYTSTDGLTLTTRDSTGYLTDTWQFASLNGLVIGVKESTAGVVMTEGVWTPSALSTPSSVQFKGIHSAYGRLWAITDSKLYWSVLLDGDDFAGAGSGSLDLQTIHTQFRDTAIAVTSFNRKIVVICRNSLYVLLLASDLNPANVTNPISLDEFVPYIGCVARDTVISTGDDVLFLSDDGVRSLARSMAEMRGPAPMTDLSASVKDYAVTNLIKGNAAASLTCAWNPEKGWYMIFAADTGEIWLFDMGQKIPQVGLPRIFIWRYGIVNPPRCGLWWTDEVMWYGANSGMYTAETYDANDDYTMSLVTGWLSLGSTDRLDQFKRVLLNMTGGNGQTAYLRWSVDFSPLIQRNVTFTLDSGQTTYEYNVDEYEVAEYSSGIGTSEQYLPLGGQGKVIQFTLDIPVQGAPLTLNNMIVFSKQGRIR